VTALLTILKAINRQKETGPFAEEVLQLENFIADLSSAFKASTELLVLNYLNNRVHSRLKQLADTDFSAEINNYFREIDKDAGGFHNYRRKYGLTVALINEKLAGMLDQRQSEAQALFPHYYERFKTDGVEHNLYIGPSIAPHLKFHIQRLYDLRLWQFQVLCEMGIAQHDLQPSLPYPLAVTTLILVYNAPIAIRFKMDEKHFDVDGSYNARFETVKKRIDKAHIIDTNERITQEGKITIVYSNDADKQEYEQYIALLQAQHLLEDQVEDFEVEDLQGVSGLKALRVKTVNREI
jgi:hypothetical protein